MLHYQIDGDEELRSNLIANTDWTGKMGECLSKENLKKKTNV